MLTSLLLAIIVALAPGSPRPTIAYTLRFDAAHLDVAELAIELRHAPTSVSLAMRVHAEYDARYWRYVDGFQIEHTANDGAASVVREDSTLWRVTLPGGTAWSATVCTFRRRRRSSASRASEPRVRGLVEHQPGRHRRLLPPGRAAWRRARRAAPRVHRRTPRVGRRDEGPVPAGPGARRWRLHVRELGVRDRFDLCLPHGRVLRRSDPRRRAQRRDAARRPARAPFRARLGACDRQHRTAPP